MTYKANIRQLRAGERIPEGEPRCYFHKTTGRMRWRWLVAKGEYLDVYADRVQEDGTIAPSKNDPTGIHAYVACEECGRERRTRRRIDGSVPPVCGRCYRGGGRPGPRGPSPLIGREDKHCWSCDTVKPSSEFGPNVVKSDKLATECRECCRIRANQRYQRTKDIQRDKWLNKQYGISVDDYQNLLDETGGTCSICRKPCVSGKRLAVDHDHETGVVRGLLCANCNRALGLFYDSPEILEEAASYLRRAAA